MERTLYTERLYSLGDYKNIKFSTALTGIPEHLANEEEIVGLIFVQQFLACEIAYRKYYDLIQKLTREGVQDVIGYLENERNKTVQELTDAIKKLGVEMNKAAEASQDFAVEYNKSKELETQEKETEENV
jgi:hypothetical protein